MFGILATIQQTMWSPIASFNLIHLLLQEVLYSYYMLLLFSMTYPFLPIQARCV
jgi:hypothetical protein